MSVRTESPPMHAPSRPRVRDAAGALALVVLASLMLAARLRLLVLSPDGRALSIAVLFVGILVASLLAPVAPDGGACTRPRPG